MREYKSYQPYKIKGHELKNRLVMPPMCMYIAEDNGYVTDFHMTHYTARAIGEIGLIIVEATGVTPNGRISDTDLGIWEDSQIAGLKELARQIKSYGSMAGIQLNHAGRKYVGARPLVGPSGIAFDETYRVPQELSVQEIHEIAANFGKAAKRVDEAGYDLLEIHGAHGYLINQFLSPHSNHRTDEYGGCMENRIRFLQEIICEIKKNWPKDKILGIRISAAEYLEDGYDETEMVEMLHLIKVDLDFIHVSTRGNGAFSGSIYPGYQVKYAELIKKEIGLPVIAVGLLDDIKLIEEVVNNERADLVAIGRELLINPNFAIIEAVKNGIDYKLPIPYEASYRK
ncbi:MAG: NADH:flavin oxidoreductase/NADH oxidase [Lachnospiraceae bacterium]